MNLLTKLQDRLFKTEAFKALLASYVSKPDALVISRQTASDEVNKVQRTLPELVKQEIEKIQTMQKHEAMRYRMPVNINSNSNPDFKPGTNTQFSYLRRMANTYPIARACINRRIRQITQLEWDVTTIDDIEGEEGYTAQIAAAKAFFKRPMGNRTRMREFLTILVDDVLTIDAVCFEKQSTRGGQLMHLIPVDPTTVALRVTETGGTPEPPDPAYVQFIQGREIASFTTDEMLYDFMGNRSYSPYGLAPLESLVLQVESAIRGALFNLNYLKENNIPEGFITLPEEIAGNKERVEEWQMWFDAMVAGDPRFTHRLKILPGGSEYTPAKKPEDMSFEHFELWLLQQTCAVFDVPPQDIGITYQVNKATSESQSDLSRERGLIPLYGFIKEIGDDILQEDLGFPALQLVAHNINPVDRKEEAEVAKLEINMGATSVDEYRIKKGEQPIGLGHYINTSKGPMLVKDFVGGKVGPLADANTAAEAAKRDKTVVDPVKEVDPAKKSDEVELEKEKLEILDLRKWRKCIYKNLEEGKKLRLDFESEYISPAMHEEIVEQLSKVNSRSQAKLVFDQYLDLETRASYTLLKAATALRGIEHEYSNP